MSDKRVPVVIGLAGGVASGKSTVAKMLAELGARVIDADQVGHEALLDPEVRRAIMARFGEDLCDDAGRIERSKLAQKVFGTPDALADLTAITHPWIRRTIAERLDASRREGALPAVVLDVSLLLESGAYEGQLDALVFIDASEGDREARAQRDRQWSASERARRESHQLPLHEKRAQAQFQIANHGTLEELRDKVKTLWSDLGLT